MKADPQVKTCMQDLSDRRERYLKDRKTAAGDPDQLDLVVTSYKQDRQILRAKKDAAVKSAVMIARAALEADLERGEFEWHLQAGPQFHKRGPAARVRRTYFVSKDLKWSLPQLQASAVLKELAGFNSHSRNGIVRGLQQALHRPYSHAIIKMDIAEYFDSIPHDLVMQKTRRLRGIDSTTVQLVEMLLREYSRISGRRKGVPQGVGISAQLAELYLSEFDREIKNLPDVVYYARYVDDVVVVVGSGDAKKSVKTAMLTALSRLRLRQNTNKGHCVITDDKGAYPDSSTIDYLGYQFRFDGKRLQTSLSRGRVALRRERLKRAFKAWGAASPKKQTPNDGRDGLLLKRVRFLASNSRLDYSKSNVIVGIYFSNSALAPDATELREFDGLLTHLISKYKNEMSQALEAKLTEISFVDGFKERTFISLGRKERERVVACWEGAS